MSKLLILVSSSLRTDFLEKLGDGHHEALLPTFCRKLDRQNISSLLNCKILLVFNEILRYVDHLRSAHGETRHVCKFCAKLFKLKGSLLVSIVTLLYQ